jgi:hypothetical protein
MRNSFIQDQNGFALLCSECHFITINLRNYKWRHIVIDGKIKAELVALEGSWIAAKYAGTFT